MREEVLQRFPLRLRGLSILLALLLPTLLRAEEVYYVNPGGEAYHRAGCRFIRKDAQSMSLEKAAEGRRPCRTCLPPRPAAREPIRSPATDAPVNASPPPMPAPTAPEPALGAAPPSFQDEPAPQDPMAQAAHVTAGTNPGPAEATPGDPALVQRLAELRAKVARLEAALADYAPRSSAGPPAERAMAGMAGPAPSMPGTQPGAMKPAGTMGGDGIMPAGAPAARMSAGAGMDMDMAGMMGMGAMGSSAQATTPQSVLPGFPGAARLYHVGATGFFLDHAQHIALTAEQEAALAEAKGQAIFASSAADRAIQQAEQDLWTLTASDQPDVARIEAKIRRIGKLAGDARLAFIRAVGSASQLLTEQQRGILTDLTPPAPDSAMPAGGMKDM